MPLLIIQPNFTSKEAHDWLVDIFVQIVDAIDPDELGKPTINLSYKEVDAIFEKAMKGLLE